MKSRALEAGASRECLGEVKNPWAVISEEGKSFDRKEPSKAVSKTRGNSGKGSDQGISGFGEIK